jgi:hypothetical protein
MAATGGSGRRIRDVAEFGGRNPDARFRLLADLRIIGERAGDGDLTGFSWTKLIISISLVQENPVRSVRRVLFALQGTPALTKAGTIDRMPMTYSDSFQSRYLNQFGTRKPGQVSSGDNSTIIPEGTARYVWRISVGSGRTDLRAQECR